ncbi:MAG: NIPSNAP family protein [Dokdonella sp.]
MDIVHRKEAQVPAAQAVCGVVELRQYTLHAGRRDELIALFEREFVASQEACGMRLLGLFRDLDDPQRFVWLRGFSDMPARAAALAAFYGGPVWQAHRSAANATMVDSDDVLLLRPARPDAGFAQEGDCAAAPAHALVIAMVWQLPVRVGADFLPWFERRTLPVLRGDGARLLASFVSEPPPIRSRHCRCAKARTSSSVFWPSKMRRRGSVISAASRGPETATTHAANRRPIR